MQVEHSNFSYTKEHRAIPATCPTELRAKIEVAREQRTTKAVTSDPEQWELLKKFASISEA